MLEQRLDALHLWARGNPLLQRFTVFTRLLLGIGFIAPGLTKLLGNRFTLMGIDTPIGFFFEAMYRTGFYWRFIGFAQVLAAVLTLIPRTATLGAALFFPIILNIFIITVSLHFTGTPFITGPMLLANLYLLCWDYHKFKPLLFDAPPAYAQQTVVEVQPHAVERVGYALAVVSGLALTLAIRGLFPTASRPLFLSALLGGLVGGMLIATGWFVLLLRQRRERRVAA